ncbi:hypothetical protein BGZ89_012734, partial [Linnemannia elongata]
MRILSITLAVSLALVAITNAAPMPMPMPMPALDENPNFDESQDEFACVEQCLQVEEQCLLVSNSMNACVVAFDSCHATCVPEVAQPGPEEPPVTPPAAPGSENDHITQINEPGLDNPTIDDAQLPPPGEGAPEETDDTTDGADEEFDDGTNGGSPD